MEQIPFQAKIPILPNQGHVPCVLLLDTSGSMSGERINKLNSCVRGFLKQLNEKTETAKLVELCIIEFNSETRLIADWRPAETLNDIGDLEAYGLTVTGQAVVEAISKINERRDVYATKGIPCFKPWLVLITDGCPTDDISLAIEEIQKMERKGQSGKIKFLPVFIAGPEPEEKTDNDYGKGQLAKFSTAGSHHLLQVNSMTALPNFFEWLGNSFTSISNSHIGDKVQLPAIKETEAGEAEMIDMKTIDIPDDF